MGSSYTFLSGRGQAELQARLKTERLFSKENWEPPTGHQQGTVRQRRSTSKQSTSTPPISKSIISSLPLVQCTKPRQNSFGLVPAYRNFFVVSFLFSLPQCSGLRVLPSNLAFLWAVYRGWRFVKSVQRNYKKLSASAQTHSWKPNSQSVQPLKAGSPCCCFHCSLVNFQGENPKAKGKRES